MSRQTFVASMVCLCGMLALFARPSQAVAPGTAKAQAAETFDPFNPTTTTSTSTAHAAPATTTTPSVVVTNSARVIVVTACSPARTVVVPGKPCLTILDPPAVTQSTTANKTINVTVTLSASSTSTVTVPYSTADGPDGGDAGTTYIATSGTLTFSPGQTSKTIPITIYKQTSNHATQHFYVNLGNPTNATICRTQATVTVNGTNIPPCISALDPAAVTQSKTTNTSVTFVVSLSASSASTVTVHYTTANGPDGGNAGTTYTAKSGTLTFTPGQTTQTVVVTILPSASPHATQHFYLNITSPTNSTICRAQATAAVNGPTPAVPCISALDPATVTQSSTTNTSVSFVVSLSASSTSTVTVKYATADGPDGGVAGTTYTAASGTLTFSPGQTTKTVPVTILKSTTSHPVEHFYLNLSGQTNSTICRAQATATVQSGPCDVVVKGPGTVQQLPTNCPDPFACKATFTITLSEACTTPVTVGYKTKDGTAIQNLDYVPKSGSVTFPAGTKTETVTVQILPENKTTNEVFYLDLTSATGASGLVITVAEASCTIRGQNSQIYVAGATVAHGTSGTTNQYARVYLDVASTQIVSVNFITVDGTAKANMDYKAVNTTVTFAPGVLTQSVAIPIIGISGSVPTRTFTVKIQAPVTGNGYLATSSATMTITGH